MSVACESKVQSMGNKMSLNDFNELPPTKILSVAIQKRKGMLNSKKEVDMRQELQTKCLIKVLLEHLGQERARRDQRKKDKKVKKSLEAPKVQYIQDESPSFSGDYQCAYDYVPNVEKSKAKKRVFESVENIYGERHCYGQLEYGNEHNYDGKDKVKESTKVLNFSQDQAMVSMESTQVDCQQQYVQGYDNNVNDSGYYGYQGTWSSDSSNSSDSNQYKQHYWSQSSNDTQGYDTCSPPMEKKPRLNLLDLQDETTNWPW